MKRSEMIEVIDKILLDYDISTIDNKLASKILTAIEKAGMSPPKTHFTVDRYYNGIYTGSETMEHAERAWEPEETYNYTNKDFAGW